jgi:yeast amino acid transporter
MSQRRESLHLEENPHEKGPIETADLGEHMRGRQFSLEAHDVDMVHADQNKLQRNLRGRHMQFIAMYVCRPHLTSA